MMTSKVDYLPIITLEENARFVNDSLLGTRRSTFIQLFTVDSYHKSTLLEQDLNEKEDNTSHSVAKIRHPRSWKARGVIVAYRTRRSDTPQTR